MLEKRIMGQKRYPKEQLLRKHPVAEYKNQILET